MSATDMHDYFAFLASKEVQARPAGFDDPGPLSPHLFPFQRDVLAFLLRVGRGATFLDTGLGKTLIQLDWARVVAERTGRPVLILTPLAVAAQTMREAQKFGIEAAIAREQSEVRGPIAVANYERLHLFDPGAFAGVVLDESSILKSFTGSTKRRLIESFDETPYRLACTATPAPNDYMELCNHAEFLGVMRSPEVLSRWFIADQANMGKYRLKGHAVAPFWNWVASWSRCIARPSDLGYSDDGFVLPKLVQRRHIVEADLSEAAGDMLFRIPETSATSIHREKRLSVFGRAEVIAGLIGAEPDEPWIVWCDTDYEADALTALLPAAVEVRGSMSADDKERRLNAFTAGESRIIVTKPSIAGFGLNWQHCARMAFVGLSFSYESYYQAVRRSWRFGQKRPVYVHVAMAATEKAIWDVVSRKGGDHEQMKAEMSAAMRRAQSAESGVKVPYRPTYKARLPRWLTPGRAA